MINSLKKLGLFSFFVAATICSCKKPAETLGESLQPSEDAIVAFQSDTTTIFARTLKIDSLRSDVFSNISVGNYIDDDFGVVRCSGVIQLAPTTRVKRYPTESHIDSVILYLAYQSEAYGKNTPMYMEVNEVTETIYLDTPYYTNHRIEKTNTNLVMPGFETVDTNPGVNFSSSSTDAVYMKLPLKHSLGEKLISTSSPLDDFELFRDYFGGLVISSPTVDGRVLSFAGFDCKLMVYFQNFQDQKSIKDTIEFAFNTAKCEAFSIVDHQYFGTAISALTVNNDIDGDYLCYAQTAGGTRIKVDLENANWLKEIPGVVINKAELIIPYDAYSKYAPIDTMTLVYQSAEDVFSVTEDFRYSGGTVNKTTGLYKFNITRHLQSLIKEEILTPEVFILANPRVAGQYNALGVRRSLLHGPGFSNTDNNQNMRLIITYSY